MNSIQNQTSAFVDLFWVKEKKNLMNKFHDYFVSGMQILFTSSLSQKSHWI